MGPQIISVFINDYFLSKPTKIKAKRGGGRKQKSASQKKIGNALQKHKFELFGSSVSSAFTFTETDKSNRQIPYPLRYKRFGASLKAHVLTRLGKSGEIEP